MQSNGILSVDKPYPACYNFPEINKTACSDTVGFYERKDVQQMKATVLNTVLANALSSRIDSIAGIQLADSDSVIYVFRLL